MTKEEKLNAIRAEIDDKWQTYNEHYDLINSIASDIFKLEDDVAEVLKND